MPSILLTHAFRLESRRTSSCLHGQRRVCIAFLVGSILIITTNAVGKIGEGIRVAGAGADVGGSFEVFKRGVRIEQPVAVQIAGQMARDE